MQPTPSTSHLGDGADEKRVHLISREPAWAPKLGELGLGRGVRVGRTPGGLPRLIRLWEGVGVGECLEQPQPAAGSRHHFADNTAHRDWPHAGSERGQEAGHTHRRPGCDRCPPPLPELNREAGVVIHDSLHPSIPINTQSCDMTRFRIGLLPVVAALVEQHSQGRVVMPWRGTSGEHLRRAQHEPLIQLRHKSQSQQLARASHTAPHGAARLVLTQTRGGRGRSQTAG